jgi:type II secretory pathway pseudopilin PulG
MKKTFLSFRFRLGNRAYSLIEVLAAGAIVAIGAGAAASLSASVGLQEDLARRVSVARNYQENMARLWQLGLDPTEIAAILPTTLGNRFLSGALFDPGVILPQGLVNVGTAGQPATVQAALIRVSANIAPNPSGKQEGSPMEIVVCRPSIGAQY